MNILITGGCGFIGRALLKILKNKHSVTVIGSFRKCSKEDFQLFIKKNGISKCKIIAGELALNIERLLHFDCVIHISENTNVQNSIDNPKEVFDYNLRTTFLLLDWCRRNKVHFVYPSTALVYATPDKSGKITEKSDVKPTCPYAAYKLAIEGIALSFYYTYNLPVTIFRIFNPYGPHQRADEGAIANMLSRKKNKEKVIIYGKGLQRRDFLFADDLAYLISKSIGNKKAYGQIFNAGYGKDISIKDLAFLIAGSKKDIEFRKHLHPKNEIKRLICDNNKAKKILGWSPKINIKEGVKRFDNWLMQKNINTK